MRGPWRRLKKLLLCGHPWQCISAWIKKNKKTGDNLSSLDCLLQGSAEAFSLRDGPSLALEDEGPGGGARRWVGVQVLTGLFGHDQLVFCLPVDNRFPVAHLCRRAASDSKQLPRHWGLHPTCAFQIGRFQTGLTLSVRRLPARSSVWMPCATQTASSCESLPAVEVEEESQRPPRARTTNDGHTPLGRGPPGSATSGSADSRLAPAMHRINFRSDFRLFRHTKTRSEHRIKGSKLKFLHTFAVTYSLDTDETLDES